MIREQSKSFDKLSLWIIETGFVNTNNHACFWHTTRSYKDVPLVFELKKEKSFRPLVTY